MLKWSARKYFGGSVMANVNLQGTSAANPTENSGFTLCAQTVDGTTDSIGYSIDIEYLAVWTEIKDIASS